MIKSISAKRKWWVAGAGAAVAVLSLAGYWYYGDCDYCRLQLSEPMTLHGTVAENCTVDVQPGGSYNNLPLTVGGTVAVGTVVLRCNKRQGYRLSVDSAGCTANADNNAVLRNTDVTTEIIDYTVNLSSNPGAIGDLTSLLSGGCSQQAYNYTNKIWPAPVTTNIAVVFTGSADYSAGTYEDVLTVTMATN